MNIFIHMKTTVDISDELFEETKRQAEKERTTVRALIEEGLRKVLSTRGKMDTFHLKKASFKGKGLQPGVEVGRWENIRELIYEGHGA